MIYDTYDGFAHIFFFIARFVKRKVKISTLDICVRCGRIGTERLEITARKKIGRVYLLAQGDCAAHMRYANDIDLHRCRRYARFWSIRHRIKLDVFYTTRQYGRVVKTVKCQAAASCAIPR